MTTFLGRVLHAKAEEELIDLGQVVHWLLQQPIRDLVAQCQMTKVFSGDPLLHFRDFFFHFFCPLGIELFFIGGKFAEQSQELSGVYTFLVRYVLEHFNG